MEAQLPVFAVIQLLHAWDEDAVMADRDTGVLVDAEKTHAVNVESPDFRVRGPLSAPRSPQVVPLIAQAGPSPAGHDLAGRYADIVYARYNGSEAMRAYRRDLRTRATSHGRGEGATRLMPNLTVYVKSTEAEARQLYRETTELNTPEVMIAEFGQELGLSLDERDLGLPVPDELRPAIERRWPDIAGSHSIDWPQQGVITWSELAQAIQHRSNHQVIVGTPTSVAEFITDGFLNGDFDGISVGTPLASESLVDFVEQVIPLLQDNGIFKREYAPGTLRDRLGMPVTQTFSRNAWTNHYHTQ